MFRKLPWFPYGNVISTPIQFPQVTGGKRWTVYARLAGSAEWTRFNNLPSVAVNRLVTAITEQPNESQIRVFPSYGINLPE